MVKEEDRLQVLDHLLTLDVQVELHVGEKRVHSQRTNVASFAAHLGEGESVGGISPSQGLLPNSRAMNLPGAAVVAEEHPPLSAGLPVPLHGDVWASVVDAELTVEFGLRA